MRIVTWNVNSIGARLDRVLAWLELNKPDVLALQELKCTDEAFPLLPIQALGYEVATLGTGRWNGVALLSRVGLDDVKRGLLGQPQYEDVDEPRAIGATCGGVRVWSVYVPNGREPDHPHYSYKLQWFAALKDTAAAELAASPQRPFTIIGDYNVAPTDADVWDIAKFENSTHVTPGERQALANVLSAGLVEVMPRALKGEPFTFWDYRQASFGRGWGMRIDLIYANQRFADAVSDAYIDREERKGKGASDHAPVVVDVDLP
ncbi:MAG: exodeoxyribonuclease III [Actinomycetota bacterium]|nr:exodeoxyribonuclease III [Actinomycetota bacterium]MDP2287333.1 exodeoxyribonuclease III [Actinomycetota bacterium]